MSPRAPGLVGLLLGTVTILGCQRAVRYPGVGAANAPAEEQKITPLPTWSWQLPWLPPEADVPIVFIAHGHKDWDSLPAFWNVFPPPAAGLRTIHFAQSPLGGAAAMVLADRLETVKIKVPLGLPDPTSNIPAANPPTFGKWKLGREIFFARKLSSGYDTFSCASCHQPDHGFAEDRGNTLGGTRNTLGLINSAYWRHQFWDGRAGALEEVVVRSLDDEAAAEHTSSSDRPQETHRWGGLVRALDADVDFRFRFETVFGLKQPTQDAVAKALATYLRTILSGNSLYDRAEHERLRQQAPQLRAEHFAMFLDGPALAALEPGVADKDSVAKQLVRGHRLFHDKGCVACHRGPLFTDHDFHNIGVGESSRFRISGQETGRFVQVPIGLKEARLVGAFRTPSLRALPRTAPYFHDGSFPDLLRVVKYFNHSIAGNIYLAEPLRADPTGLAKALDMDSDDQDALVLFLRSLDGGPVDRIVAAPGERRGMAPGERRGVSPP
ncbi:MAG: c-type cytochrome [Gemmataceae bacterium]|nr:c-type cytochrome [Gemmataceae bacterium]